MAYDEVLAVLLEGNMAVGPRHGPQRDPGGGAPARQSRQIALKYTLRTALGGVWMVTMNVLFASLRRRIVGSVKRPSAPIRAL